MTVPMTEAELTAMMTRAGLSDLTPQECEEIRQATRHVALFAARVRAPALPDAVSEPATRFQAQEPRR